MCTWQKGLPQLCTFTDRVRGGVHLGTRFQSGACSPLEPLLALAGPRLFKMMVTLCGSFECWLSCLGSLA